MIWMNEDMDTMIAVFDEAAKPLRMFDAIGLALPTPEQLGDGQIRRADPDRWTTLVRAVVDLWQQGCLGIAAACNGLHDDVFVPTSIGRNIAAGVRRRAANRGADADQGASDD